MPPEYGIVDGTGFYHIDVVTGPPPSRVGERVACDGVPNTDGGKYQWRIVRLVVERPPAPVVERPPPPVVERPPVATAPIVRPCVLCTTALCSPPHLHMLRELRSLLSTQPLL